FDARLPEDKGRMANRPAASLNRLFRLPRPQTNASSEQRTRAMERLMAVCPDATFQMIVRHLGEIGFGFVMDVESRQPALRSLNVIDRDEDPGPELNSRLDLALTHMGTDAARWAYLLRKGGMRVKHGARFLEQLEICHANIHDE